MKKMKLRNAWIIFLICTSLISRAESFQFQTSDPRHSLSSQTFVNKLRNAVASSICCLIFSTGANSSGRCYRQSSLLELRFADVDARRMGQRTHAFTHACTHARSMHARADVYARGHRRLHVCADVCSVLGIETSFLKTRENASEGVEAGVRALRGELWIALNVSRGTASIRTRRRIKGACVCNGDERKTRHSCCSWCNSCLGTIQNCTLLS